MAPKRSYTHDVSEVMEPLRFFFGTPKPVYDLMRCKEAAIDWPLFYRAWREDRTTARGKNALMQLVSYFMLEVGPAIAEQRTDWRLSDKAVEKARYWMKHTKPTDEDDTDDHP